MYVIDTQTEEYGSAVAGNISFDYGNVHFDLMDSNPWALFQMNAETSGGKMDAAIADKIEKSVQWLGGGRPGQESGQGVPHSGYAPSDFRPLHQDAHCTGG